MLIEYALIAGLVEAVSVAVKEQNQLPVKESIGVLNSTRNKITTGLINLGMLKNDICSRELCDFLILFDSFIALTNSYGYSKSFDSGLSNKDIKQLIDLLKSVNDSNKNGQFKKNNQLLIEYAISDKVFNTKNKNTITRTIAWIVYPAIKDNKLLKSQDLICGGKVGEFAVVASGCPHLINSETKYRKALKDEKSRKEVIKELNNARKELDKISCKINEVYNVLKHEKEKIATINSKLGMYLNKNNGVEYEYMIVEEIVKYGLDTFTNIRRILFVDVFDNDGLISKELKYLLSKESFQKEVASQPDFTKYDKYCREYIDIYEVKEDNLSDYNIKIIDSDLLGNEVKYFNYYLHNNNGKWVDCDKDSVLCYEDKFISNIENNLNELVDELEKNLSLGVMNTSLFYLGNEKTFKSLKKVIKKSNVKIIYLGDGHNEQ